jgi:hypothetical protein
LAGHRIKVFLAGAISLDGDNMSLDSPPRLAIAYSSGVVAEQLTDWQRRHNDGSRPAALGRDFGTRILFLQERTGNVIENKGRL